MKIDVFVLFTFVSCCSYLSLGGVIVDEIVGKLDEQIIAYVSRNQQVLVTYDMSQIEGHELEDDSLSFEFSSDDATQLQPIVITITSDATVQQVMLPKTAQASAVKYSRTSSTLCLVNATLQRSTVISISITATSSIESMSFNMTAFLFRNYTLGNGQWYEKIAVAPASPVSYRYEFPEHDDAIDAVMVLVTSPDDRCSVLSVQRDSCPINIGENDIKFEGTYQTFTRQAAITVNKNLFDTVNFFIVVAVLSSDRNCEPTLPNIAWHITTIKPIHEELQLQSNWTPLIHSIPRQKTINVKIEKVATKRDIIAATGSAVGLLLLVAIVCLVLICTVTKMRLRAMVEQKEILSQCSPLDEIDERTLLLGGTSPITRRRSSVPQAHSTPSVHTNYGSVQREGDDEVTIRTPSVFNSSESRYMSAVDETSGGVLEQNSQETLIIDDAVRDVSPINESAQLQNLDDNSSVDSSDYDKIPEYDYDKKLIRAKTKIFVSDLATKKPRNLIKKYSLYPWNLGIVSFFYVLPVVQLVLAYQIATIHLGNQDTCYYNFRCATPLLGFSAFNNVFSNVAYVVLGFLFIIIVRYHDGWLRNWEYRTVTRAGRRDSPLVSTIAPSPSTTIASQMVSFKQPVTSLGIPPIHGISYALGIALIMEGIMSACYHVCPNSSNFQFDTTYMYITAWLLIAKIYQSRHPDIGRNAHLFFVGVAVIIFLAMLGAVFGVDSIFFYILLMIVMVPMTFDLSLYFYFMGSFKMDVTIGYRVYHACCQMVASRSLKPDHPFRLVFVAVFNSLNWGMAIFGIVTHPTDFDTFLLTISISNVMLYTVYYVSMKIRHKERIHPLAVLLVIIAAGFWASAFFFFVEHQTTWQLTPAESRNLNKPCILFNFFDAHDIWHFLSAFALFSSFLILLVIDDEIMLQPRDRIPVF